MSRYTAKYVEGEGEALHYMGHLLTELSQVPNMDPSESLTARRRYYLALAHQATSLAGAAVYAARLVDKPKPRRRSAASSSEASAPENEMEGEA